MCPTGAPLFLETPPFGEFCAQGEAPQEQRLVVYTLPQWFSSGGVPRTPLAWLGGLGRWADLRAPRRFAPGCAPQLGPATRPFPAEPLEPPYSSQGYGGAGFGI